MNIADWIALSIIAAAVICAVVYMVKRRKNGCGGGCGGCPYSSSCGKNYNSERNTENECSRDEK